MDIGGEEDLAATTVLVRVRVDEVTASRTSEQLVQLANWHVYVRCDELADVDISVKKVTVSEHVSSPTQHALPPTPTCPAQLDINVDEARFAVNRLWSLASPASTRVFETTATATSASA